MFQMPTSSAMIMTMLGFAGVCANAAPPNASGSDTITLERQLFLIIAHSPFSQSLHGRAFPDDASEPNVTGGRIDRLRVSCGRPIAAAIVRRAQMRAAFQNFPWDAYLRQAGIEAFVLASAARILRNAARLRRVCFMSWRIPVGRPFPDIPDHVVDAVAVRRKGRDRRGAIEPVGAEILIGEFTLPGVGHVAAAWRELFAPGVFDVGKSTAGGKLPFRFGWKILAGPAREGERIGIGQVHDRMIVKHVDVALWAVWMAPVGALHELPPLAPIAEIDG